MNMMQIAQDCSHPHNDSIFTDREKECIRLLLIGYTAKMTANKLNISPRTVEKHLDNIKRKLGVSRKIELIHLVTKLGLFD